MAELVSGREITHPAAWTAVARTRHTLVVLKMELPWVMHGTSWVINLGGIFNNIT